MNYYDLPVPVGPENNTWYKLFIIIIFINNTYILVESAVGTNI